MAAHPARPHPEQDRGPDQTEPAYAEDGEDMWRHRNARMRCRTCMWYAAKTAEVGRCRCHAPTMMGYPVVFPMDWCGDHKLDESAP